MSFVKRSCRQKTKNKNMHVSLKPQPRTYPIQRKFLRGRVPPRNANHSSNCMLNLDASNERSFLTLRCWLKKAHFLLPNRISVIQVHICEVKISEHGRNITLLRFDWVILHNASDYVTFIMINILINNRLPL